MDKEILNQYIDACELIRETEQEIKRLRRRRREIVTDKVKGSMQDFPYAPQSYRIQGLPYNDRDHEELDRQESILNERRAAAEVIKLQVEEWMLTIPQRMQRIIRYKIFEEMTWAEVAVRMGRKATADGVRKEFENFMKAA